MTSPEYHAKPKKSKSKNWFYHDADARRDPKLIYLQLEGGFEFKGLWWDLIEYLRETDGYKVPSKLFKSVLLSLGTSTEVADKFLKTCLFCELLVEKESSIYSESLIDRMSGYEAMCERNKANAKRPLSGRRARRQRAIPIPIPILDPIQDPIPIPKEGMQGEPEPFTFPFDVRPACRDAIERWKSHICTKHKRQFTQQQVDATLMSYALRPDELIENINHSIISGYRSIYQKPPDVGKAPIGKQEKNVQDAADLFKKYKQEGR